MQSFTTDLEQCPDCKASLNDSQGTIKVGGHDAWADWHGNVLESLTEDVSLILDDSHPTVVCEECGADLAEHFIGIAEG